MKEISVIVVAMLAKRKHSQTIKAMEAKSSTDEPQTITAQEALEYMRSNREYALVDVRMPEEYSMGHIPGAINIPLETIVTEKLAELPNLNQVILVYCHGGSRSQKAGQRLKRIGYTKVYCFGGIDTWTGSIVK
ncbi:MAG: rhodanese-like domain-containing protein [Lachnospiraceae bacterium]|nr:rhodanese-like domain-containing protein [Lachnospiraceae bacterium]